VSGQTTAPLWRQILEIDQQERLVSLVNQECDAAGIPADFDGTSFTLTAPGGERLTAGLDNVAHMIVRAPSEQWRGVVSEHLQTLISHAGQRPPADFEEAAPGLRIRLFPDDTAGLETFATAALAPGIVQVLAYDLPDVALLINNSTLRQWGVGFDVALLRAAANTRHEPHDSQQVPMGETVSLTVIEGESVYTASHLLWLGDVAEVGEHGALVVVPNRHLMVTHSIAGADAARAVAGLIGIAHDAYARGPGAISWQLYWWRDGALTVLPHHIEANRLQFDPPDDFLALLDRLQ
jgi:hypothetical protein